jgi:hypothetical protein
MALPPTPPQLPRIATALRGYGPQASHLCESSRGSATTATVAAAVFDSLYLPHPPPISRPQTAAAAHLRPEGVLHPQPKPKPIHPRALAFVGRPRGSVDSSSITITRPPTDSSPKRPLPSRLAPLTPPLISLAEQANLSGSTLPSTLSPDSCMTAPSPSLEARVPPFPRGFDPDSFDPDSRGIKRARPDTGEDDTHIEEIT